MAGEKKNDYKWSYSVQNGIEKSKRSYLLVYASQTKKERLITVVSHCEKILGTGGRYGTCTHKIDIQPTKVNFSLNTGEDVVMISASVGFGDTLILGTIAYGCCGTPNFVRFYTEYGKYIGSLQREDLHSFNNNMITNMFVFGNSTWDDEKRSYFAVEDEENYDKYYAWVKEGKREIVKVPILYTNPDKEKCKVWYLAAFSTYAVRPGITMILKGRYCNTTEDQERLFSCYKTESTINCSPIPK